MARIYTYRISKGPELHSFTFLSHDPLPGYATLDAIEYFATYSRTEFSWWWVVGPRQGVSIDEAHALRQIRKWGKQLPDIPFRGRIAREIDCELEEGSEPTVLGEREAIDDA